MADLSNGSNLKQLPPNTHSDKVLSDVVERLNDHLIRNVSYYPELRKPELLSVRIISKNFIVHAPDYRVATEVASEAEKLRVSLAKTWLGKELPEWKEPLAIAAMPGNHLGAAGNTTFLPKVGGVQFNGTIVQGSKERILDSVLPHELMHAVLATHFNAATPRWADEGISTFVESKIEKDKHDKNLINYIREGRGIPFAILFTTKEYPKDILPLYAQGYSLTKYLIELGDQMKKENTDGLNISGQQRIIKYLERGMSNEDWVSATKEYYGFEKIGKLQTAWNSHVASSITKHVPENNKLEPIKIASINNASIKNDKESDFEGLYLPPR